MSWKLEVTEVFLNDSDKYLANKYPGVGVFKCGNDLMAVTSHPVGAAYSIPGGAGILAASLPAPPEPVRSMTFSEDFLLKFAAIAQKPDLATALVNKA